MRFEIASKDQSLRTDMLTLAEVFGATAPNEKLGAEGIKVTGEIDDAKVTGLIVAVVNYNSASRKRAGGRPLLVTCSGPILVN
jgi:hypothetical protein